MTDAPGGRGEDPCEGQNEGRVTAQVSHEGVGCHSGKGAPKLLSAVLPELQGLLEVSAYPS